MDKGSGWGRGRGRRGKMWTKRDTKLMRRNENIDQEGGGGGGGGGVP